MSNESEPRSISQHVAYRGEAKEAARIHPLAECHIGAVADFTHLAVIEHIHAAACLLLKECLMLAKRDGLHSLLLTTRIIEVMFLGKRCDRSIVAVINVISVISLSFYRIIHTIPSIIVVISVISVISLITLTCTLMVITPIHTTRGKTHHLVRLKVFLPIIVPLRWLSLPLMIPLTRKGEVAPMQSHDLTSFLHLAQN